METLLNYESGNRIKGHLEIVKIYADGTEELHFSDENVITSGLGYTLLKAFATSGAGSIEPFQIQYFQLGVAANDSLQVSSTGSLSASLSEANYGTANFEISTHDLSSGTPAAAQPFGVIAWPYIKKISPTRVMYQIFLGDEAAEGITLSEVGLFSKNPNLSVAKQDSFSVLFRWTIEF